MKLSLFLKQLLLFTLSIVPVVHGDILLPGGDDPHGNKDIVFDGSISFWANDLYGFTEGKAVIFENAGTVSIEDAVKPASILVKGEGKTTLSGLGQITGETKLIKEGNGTLEMNAVNSYSGGTQITAGTVKSCSATAFGSGVVELNGGTLDLGGIAIDNEIHLNGGVLIGAAGTANLLVVNAEYNITENISARGMNLADGLRLSVAAGATLTLEEELELKKASVLDLSAGGSFRGKLLVESDGVLKLSSTGTTGMGNGCDWHLNGAKVSGNLATAAAAAARTSTGSLLRISGKCSLSGSLTLNGGMLKFSDTQASLHASTVALSAPTALAPTVAPASGESHTFLTYNRLLRGSVTDYYDFFGLSEDEYELKVGDKSMTLTAIEPQPEPEAPTPDTPVISPTPDDPDIDSPTPPDTDDDTPNAPGPEIPEDEKPEEDNPHGPVIDSSGDDPDDPHQNQEEEDKTDNDDTADVDDLLSEESGTALSQACMQSAWGSMFASHAFMSAVYDNSRNRESTTWAALYGGVQETDNEQNLPGGDASVYGLALGVEGHPTEQTQLGLALGGSLGTVSGDSFGKLDQMSVHAAVYVRHSFMKPDSRQHLRLYGALGLGRTETDPGSYSGLESWYHNSAMAKTRLSWGMKLTETLTWDVYGGADYYHGSDVSADDEQTSGICNLRGSIGSGIAWSSNKTTLYAEAEFNGDIVRDNPTTDLGGREFRTAEPERCGFTLRCGMMLHPDSSDRHFNLNYAFESRSTTSAHVISAGFTRIF